MACTQAEVEHCWGVLQTNSISVGGTTGRALFPLVSLLSHSCLPCLEPALAPSAQSGITLRARRTIKAGEELTMPYTDVLLEVRARQENLRQEWHFSCTCPRCSDPSEAGSFFSSLQCTCGGFATRPYIQKIHTYILILGNENSLHPIRNREKHIWPMVCSLFYPKKSNENNFQGIEFLFFVLGKTLTEFSEE